MPHKRRHGRHLGCFAAGDVDIQWNRKSARFDFQSFVKCEGFRLESQVALQSELGCFGQKSDVGVAYKILLFFTLEQLEMGNETIAVGRLEAAQEWSEVEGLTGVRTKDAVSYVE